MPVTHERASPKAATNVPLAVVLPPSSVTTVPSVHTTISGLGIGDFASLAKHVVRALVDRPRPSARRLHPDQAFKLRLA